MTSKFSIFENSDSLLEEFADKLAIFDPFPLGNEDVDIEAELREIKLLLNRDPSTKFSPRITFDPNPERFTNEPSLVFLPPPGDECECNVPDSQTINFLTFSNPLFDYSAPSNDESSHEEVTHEMSCITYSNPLFDLDKEIISIFSPRNDPLHHEFAGEIITKSPSLMLGRLRGGIVTLHRDENRLLFPMSVLTKRRLMMRSMLFLAIQSSSLLREGYYDSEGDVFYLEKLLIDDTTHNLFPEVLFDHEPQCFKDESELDTLENMVKVFDPGIWEKTFSPSCVRLSSKDHHYLLFTIVVQILFTHHVNFLFSFGSEDTIFDPVIFAFQFSSQEPVAVKCSMEFCHSSIGCTDIAKITGKRSKLDKHGHRNGKSAQEPGV
ncbi:hypothetical protein Tco_0872239 [Tanacetum coccineum]